MSDTEKQTLGPIIRPFGGVVKGIKGGEQSQSVARSIAILNAVARAPHPLSIAEIIAATGLGKTAVLRFVTTLSAHGLLERDQVSRKYRLGPALVEMAHSALHRHPLLLRAAGVLDEIVRITGDIGLLMVEDRGASLCIERKVGASPIATVGTRIGTRSPLHCGGGPFALLAFSPNAFIEDYLSRPLEARTKRTITDPAIIRERIQQARINGFTVGDEDLFEYIVAVGVPIFYRSGKLLGSLSIGNIKYRYSAERCLEVGKTLSDLCKKMLG